MDTYKVIKYLELESKFSFGEAVLKTNKEKKELERAINGRVLVNFYYDGFVFIGFLDNDIVFKISQSQRGLQCELVHFKTDTFGLVHNSIECLQYAGGNKTVWDPQRIFNSLKSKKIAVSIMENTLTIRAQGTGTFLFDYLQIEDIKGIMTNRLVLEET